MTIAFKPTASSTTIEHNGSTIATINSTGLTMAAGKTIVGSGVGKILQVVQATKTDVFSSTSTSNVDITGLSLSITPSSTSSKILLMCSVFGSTTNACNLYLVRNSTVVINGTSGYTHIPTFAHMTSNNVVGESVGYNYLDSPSTTSAITYKIQGNTDAGTFYINRRGVDTFINPTSSLIAMEVAA